MFMVHYAPKVASSQAKIDRNFANYFLKLNKKDFSSKMDISRAPKKND